MLLASPFSFLPHTRAKQCFPPAGAQVRAPGNQHVDAPDSVQELGAIVARCLPKNLRDITGMQHPSLKKVGECWVALTKNCSDGEAATAELRAACRNVRNPDSPQFTFEKTPRVTDLIARGVSVRQTVQPTFPRGTQRHPNFTAEQLQRLEYMNHWLPSAHRCPTLPGPRGIALQRGLVVRKDALVASPQVAGTQFNLQNPHGRYEALPAKGA